MGCCALESGDAISAIPFRNLNELRSPALPLKSAGGIADEPQKIESRDGGKMPMVHPNAAAIDVGATMHMAAVGADRAPEPVRSFGTFTADLHRLVDWFTECGVETVVMESTVSTGFRSSSFSMPGGLPCFLSTRATPSTCRGARPMSAMRNGCSGSIHSGCCEPAFGPKGRIAELRAYVRQRERLLEYAASHIQHMQKALTEMNLQLHHVVADITGSTGLRIIRAILAGRARS